MSRLPKAELAPQADVLAGQIRRILTSDLLNFHQHQYDGTQLSPNDCATTSMAMAMNMALQELGYGDDLAQHGPLAQMLENAPREVFRVFRMPGVGAMPPGRMADALNLFADEMVEAGIPVRGRRR